MLDAKVSGCINHPGIEAIGRCKQCSTPFCGACEIRSARGRFCSDVCRDKFEQFAARARQLDNREPRPGILTRLRMFGFKLAAWVCALGAVAFGLAYFDAPYAGQVARRLFELIGLQIGP